MTDDEAAAPPKRPKGPTPPKLPEGAPRELSDFVECRTKRLEVKAGPLNWFRIPGGIMGTGKQPRVTLDFPPGGGLPSITVSWDVFTLTIPLTIESGELGVDTSRIPEDFSGVGAAVKRWLDQLNRWLKARGFTLYALPVFAAPDPNWLLLEKRPLITKARKPTKPGRKTAAAVGAAVVLAGGGTLTWTLTQGGDEPSGKPSASATAEPVQPPAETSATAALTFFRLGQKLGTSQITVERSGDTLVFSFSDGATVYRGTIQDDGTFRTTYHGDVFTGTLSGTAIEGTTRYADGGESRVEGRLGPAP